MSLVRRNCLCVISGFRGGVNEYDLFWDFTHRGLVVLFTGISGQPTNLCCIQSQNTACLDEWAVE
jgi:hypothetical protein